MMISFKIRCRLITIGSLLMAAGTFAQQPAQAQALILGNLQGRGCDSMVWLISAMGKQKPDTLRLRHLPASTDTYQMEVMPNGQRETFLSADSLYQLIAIGESRQIIHPVSFAPGQLLKIDFADHQVTIGSDADNQALTAIARDNLRLSKRLWEEGTEMDAAAIARLLGAYHHSADSIIKSIPCRPTVEQYILLSAYTSMRGQYDNLDFITKNRSIRQQMEAGDYRLWPDEDAARQQLLDTPMALYFNPATHIIMQALPKGSLEEGMAALRQQFKCQEVINKVSDLMIWNFITNFDYGNHYDEGLALMSRLTDDYHLDTSYLEAFKKRKYATQGAPFPSEVILTDSTGKRIDFASFRGKYVYIDVWASWCVPCIREIPHLQQLEKELNGSDIAFVSISIDQDARAWKKKRDALNLHGNQLHDSNNQLANCLNITGIPKFLIYDKQGRLLHYDAPRPSSGERLKNIFSRYISASKP